jgi:Leucine-rich repeat (LRR) protein
MLIKDQDLQSLIAQKLKHLPYLTRLELKNNRLTKAPCIKSLPNLKLLNLTENPITDIESILIGEDYHNV